MARKPDSPLRYGWTTGACATAAAKSAHHALLTGRHLDPVRIVLPKGQTPDFALAEHAQSEDWASAGIVKDAGDDPDATHGALIVARVSHGAPGAGVRFRAGEGVGMATKPGLPIPPGEPAINPVPRRMMTEAIVAQATGLGAAADADVEISIPGGAAIALRTWNPRLGIEGGLSILGTTGIVRPFSCAAWIASIHRGVDVARAVGAGHVAGATGSTSEAAVKALYGLPDHALLDMGDFVGGLFKYLRRNPVPRLSVVGGFGKMVKLGQGALDLHSGRSQVDFPALARMAAEVGADAAAVAAANTAGEALEIAGPALAQAAAAAARRMALSVLAGASVEVETIIIDRGGAVVGRAGF